MWACRSLDVVVWGNKRSLFPCFTMKELGEDSCEKGGALSHIGPTCNLIDIQWNSLHLGSATQT